MTTVQGSITIMNAWAIEVEPASAGQPYRDEPEKKFVCTLCGGTITTCSQCGRHFEAGQSIEGDGCVALIEPQPMKPPPMTWWERFLAVHRRAALVVAVPEDPHWVSVPNRPHQCRICTRDT